ncbi:MAG: DUF3144 domain-containing protein [Gammaproteobacteria bacterium]|nr:DUF3144 domain-containing protein [Gammaproteobacteria bacterium]
MAENRPTAQEYNELSARFVELANKMKDDGKDINMISAALMSASGIYATFVAAGGVNESYLKPEGVDRVVLTYRANLESIQRFKKQQLNPEVTSS